MQWYQSSRWQRAPLGRFVLMHVSLLQSANANKLKRPLHGNTVKKRILIKVSQNIVLSLQSLTVTVTAQSTLSVSIEHRQSTVTVSLLLSLLLSLSY